MTHIAIPKRIKIERVYVKVASEFDSTGYMQPTSITWADGRTFPIETVRDFRPAGTADNDCNGDCFTVLIQGQEKHLFFEHIDPRFTGRLGRWYVLSMEQRGPVIRRVSGIRSVKPAPAVPPEQWQEAQQAVTDRFARCGCSGAMPAGEPVLVRARLNFSSAPGLQNQFAREIRLGRIVEREDGIYYEAEVNDPLELLPLLRSYAPWLRVLPGAHTLDQRLREDLLLMRQAAEGARNETIQ